MEINHNGRRRINPNKAVISLRRKQIERHPPINDYYYFERNHRETVSMLIIRNRSHLLAFLVVLGQFAMIDTINFLPTGILLYSVGIALMVEVVGTKNDDDDEDGIAFWIQKEEQNRQELIFWKKQQQQLQQQLQKQQKEDLRKGMKDAMFEWHVLRNRPNVKIIPRRENGKTVLYAI